MPKVDEQAGVELGDYIRMLRMLRKNWLLILVSTVLGAIGAGAFSLTTTPSYEASTSMYISIRGSQATTGDLIAGSTYARQAMASYQAVISSAVVLNRVIDDLGLAEDENELASSISVSSPSNTVLLNVTVTRDDPAQAAAVANSLGKNFVYVVTNVLEKSEAGQPSAVQIETIDPAVAPEFPSSPNTARNVTLGLILGLMVGVGATILRSTLDTRVRRTEDITRLTDLPVLARILGDPKATTNRLIVHTDPTSPRSESFRSLRTALQFVNLDDSPRSFMVTSSTPGEGKTTVAANLAIAVAQTGASVALIDGDMRKPSVARYMGIEGAVGLSNVLAGVVDIDEVLQKWGGTELFILPAGRIPPNPSELLGSARMRETLAELTSRFDYVIIDTPPVLSVTDAVLVSRSAGGTMLVAASGIVRREDILAALAVLDGAANRLIGVVMTHMPHSGSDANVHTRREDKPVEDGRKRGEKSVKLNTEEAPALDRAAKDPLGWLVEPDDVPSRHAR